MNVIKELLEEMEAGQAKLAEDMKSGQKEISKMKERVKQVEEIMNKKFESLKNKLQNAPEETKRTCTPNPAAIKISTFDGKTSWQVYKAQFTMITEANGWSPGTKACQLAASLRGDAADILETLSEEQRRDFQALSSALELRFGEKCTKEYSRLQLKSRYQKVGEGLQELAADIQRLSHLAFSDCPVSAREDLALQYFVDSVRDPETQKALRLADVKDIGSALVYAHKIEAAQQASRKDRHFIRAVSATDPSMDIMREIEDLRRQFRNLEERRSGGNRKIQCWSCGEDGHVRRDCSMYKDSGNKFPPLEGN